MKSLPAILILLATALVSAQTALDPTQGGLYPKFPDYLNRSCGGIAETQYGATSNADGTTDAAFKFYTNCNGSGRGAKDTRYLSCWDVRFSPDGVTVVGRELLLYATWKQGQVAVGCPGL